MTRPFLLLLPTLLAAQPPSPRLQDQDITFRLENNPAGAIQRSVQSKLSDVPAVSDFRSLKCDGTDQTTSIVAALASADPNLAPLTLPVGCRFDVKAVQAALAPGQCIWNLGIGGYWSQEPARYREKHYGLICGDTQGNDSQFEIVSGYHSNLILNGIGTSAIAGTYAGWGTLWFAGGHYAYNTNGSNPVFYGAIHGSVQPGMYAGDPYEFTFRSYWQWDAMGGSKGIWAPGTRYAQGDFVRTSNIVRGAGVCRYYKDVTPGTVASGRTMPAHTDGSTASDGAIEWQDQGLCYRDSGLLTVFGDTNDPRTSKSIRPFGRVCSGTGDSGCLASFSANATGDGLALLNTASTAAGLFGGVSAADGPYLQSRNWSALSPANLTLQPEGGNLYMARKTGQVVSLGSFARAAGYFLDGLAPNDSVGAGYRFLRTETTGGYISLTDAGPGTAFSPVFSARSLGPRDYFGFANNIASADDTDNVAVFSFHASKDGAANRITTRPLFSVLNGTSAELSLSNAGDLAVTGTLKANTGGSANHVVCWRADKTLGYCSTAVAADGSCTCN